MKKYITVANEMFKEPLPDKLSPTEITKLFISDYYECRKFAYEESKTEKPEKEWNIGKSYDNLIIKYCGLDKNYQGLAYGSNGEKLTETKILNEVLEGSKAIVTVKYQNPEIEFINSNYEYHFVKSSNNGNWILEEKYFVDDDDGKHKYL